MKAVVPGVLRRNIRDLGRVLVWVALLAWGCGRGGAAELPGFDFRGAGEVSSWRAQHDVAGITPTPEGMGVRISGPDPYLAGPSRNYPAGMLLWLNVRLRSETGGTAQMFYYPSTMGPTEVNSVRFPVPAGVWYTARVPVAALGSGYSLRLDPPGESGICTYERLWFEERIQHAAPAWLAPVPPETTPGDPSVRSGAVTVVHRRDRMGALEVLVDGVRMAVGQTRPLLGYLVEGRARWWSMGEASTTSVREGEGTLEVLVVGRDPDGAGWRITQNFRGEPAEGAGAGEVQVETTVEVDRDRSLLHLPVFTLFAGLGQGGFGTAKQQALLAGVEYLDNEPSSSEADLEGVQARRQVADTAKLTFPLAAVVAADRYLGLVWDMQPSVAVVFDTPDRIFRSGGHVLGLVVPGSDGLNREEGSLVPYDPWVLAAGRKLVVRAWILGGQGRDAVPVIRQYHAMRGLPPVPPPGMTAVEYSRLAARGWLETGIRDGDLYRHAVVGSFGSGPAADAAYFMDFLSDRVADEGLSARLRLASVGALGRVSTNQRHASAVGHVRTPVAPLIYGSVVENADAALASGRAGLGRFAADGTVRYVRSGAINFARTHWTNEANGLTAQAVQAVLEAASFSGNPSLIDAGLRQLRALGKFRGGVPRGAQTWEVPLHTPDILASAHLVRAYTLGYQVSGDPAWLEEAKYWAWTGVPFVYLRSPVEGPVGSYATTPVLGATQWVAPNWIGLPVQWCGLVYADALYQLAALDGQGPWKTLADGITASGVQQTFPASDTRYRGLLPDSFTLKAQQRNPANINPATLLASAVRYYGMGPVHDSRRFTHHGAWVHAAGRIEPLHETRESFVFRVHGWSSRPHKVLINGLHDAAQVRIEGRETPLLPPHVWFPGPGRMILEIQGTAEIEILHAARTAILIERERGTGLPRIRWSQSAEGFGLESATDVLGTNGWRRESEGSEPSVTLAMDGPLRIFRLRREAGR